MSTETKDPQAALFAALARLQTELPVIAKSSKVKTPQWSGDYADLAELSQALMPVLGRNGLAFTAWPTMSDGKFVLAYKLVHEDGGKLEGEYMITAGSPQQTGSAITYARRYCLCAVTGAAPGGEDDDGGAAEQAYRHRVGEPPNGREQQRGQVSRPAQQPKTAQAASTPEDFGDWGIAIDGIARGDQDAADRIDADLKAAFKAGTVNADRANKIRAAIKARAAKVMEPA